MRLGNIYAETANVLKCYRNFRAVKGEHTKLYMGVELEVNALDNKVYEKDGPYGNIFDSGQLRAGHRVMDTLKDHIVIKPEGVQNGFEIVTSPATLRYHREVLWNGFFEDAQTYLGGDSGCGMHIHFSRNAVDDKTLAKVIVFYHEPVNNKFLSGIAGRIVNAEVQWRRSIKKTFDPARPSVTIEEANPHSYVPPLYAKYINEQQGRGAICVSSRQAGNTCEVRIFQSMVDQDHVFSSLEFVVAVIDWCKYGEDMVEKDIVSDNFIRWFVREQRQMKFPYLYEKLRKLKYITELVLTPDEAQITHTRAREDVA